MFLEALLIGGTVYAGMQTYQQFRTKTPINWWKLRQRRWRPLPAPSTSPTTSPAMQKANQDLALSSASVGLTVSGVVLMQPLLTLASIPLLLYVFAPTYRAAYQVLRAERRITNPVLDATRVTLCVVMGYTFIGALNAWLQAFSQRLSVQADDELQQTLTQLFGATTPVIWAYTNGAEVETQRTAVKIGDVIVLGPGDIAPAAGVVLYGAAQVDEWLALGMVEPSKKGIGDRVAAASMVESGQLYLQLEQLPPPPLADLLHTTLQQTPNRKTHFQVLGEQSADRMAPRMFGAFVLLLPLLGVNHAAAFLCTGFGAHMRTLGPLSVRRFISQAAHRGLLIKDPRALEVGNLINTLVFDAELLTDPVLYSQAKAVVQALRQRPWLMEGMAPHRFAVYVMVQADDDVARRLVAELGLDDYLCEPSITGQALLIEQLQAGGRRICYVGQGRADAAVMEKAAVAIALRDLTTIDTTPAHIILLDHDLHGIEQFFRLATLFGVKQGVNLVAPIALDIIDLFTTLVLHFGLVYSVLFNYSGLLLGAFYAKVPARLPVAATTSSTVQTLPALPAPTATADPLDL